MPTDTLNVALPVFKRGKVRDVYDLGERLFMVASDRISAFDVVLPTPIPDKGRVLNEISAFWFKKLDGIIPNHMISTDVAEFPPGVGDTNALARRSMVVLKTDKLPVECIVRGHLAGSGWKDYKTTRSICGITLPEGLQESEKLPTPIFTPTTKAEDGGHDVQDADTQQELLRLRAVANVVILGFTRPDKGHHAQGNGDCNTKELLATVELPVAVFVEDWHARGTKSARAEAES